MSVCGRGWGRELGENEYVAVFSYIELEYVDMFEMVSSRSLVSQINKSTN